MPNSQGPDLFRPARIGFGRVVYPSAYIVPFSESLRPVGSTLLPMHDTLRGLESIKRFATACACMHGSVRVSFR